jgi:competence protein ComEC
MENETKPLFKYLIFPLCLFLVLEIIALNQAAPDFLLHVNFFDVGQGDATFVQTFMGVQVLIDGGPSDRVLQGLSHSMSFFDRKIDLLILTHPHSDHLSGLIDVLKRFRVKKVMLPEVAFESAQYQEFLNLIESKHIEKIYIRAGQRVWLDKATVFDAYYPDGQVAGANFRDGFSAASQDLNNVSVVGKLSFGKIRVLFTGDVDADVERQLTDKYNLSADVLKVSHHGSSFSSSQELLDETAAKFAVIFVGKNSYGHPALETINNLESRNIRIFRTDQDREVDFASDGQEINRVN